MSSNDDVSDELSDDFSFWQRLASRFASELKGSSINRTSGMKTLQLVFLLCISFAAATAQSGNALGSGNTTAAAQKQTETQASEPWRFGAYCAAQAQINTAKIPDGWKTAPRFLATPDIGLSLLVPVQSFSGIYASLDCGFHSTASVSKPYLNPDESNTMVLGVRYLSICPSIALSYGFLGLGINLPLGASLESLDGSIQQRSVASGTMNEKSSTLISQCKLGLELRLGGQLPLIEDAQGSLFATACASYSMTSAFSSNLIAPALLYPSKPILATNDPHPAALSVGLRYLFELSH